MISVLSKQIADIVKTREKLGIDEGKFNKALAEAEEKRVSDVKESIASALYFKKKGLWEYCLKASDEALARDPGNSTALALQQEASLAIAAQRK